MAIKIVGAAILILTHIFAYRIGRMSMLHDLEELDTRDPEKRKDWPHDIVYFALKYYSKDRNS